MKVNDKHNHQEAQERFRNERAAREAVAEERQRENQQLRQRRFAEAERKAQQDVAAREAQRREYLQTREQELKAKTRQSYAGTDESFERDWNSHIRAEVLTEVAKHQLESRRQKARQRYALEL